jgi:hypothetical protein
MLLSQSNLYPGYFTFKTQSRNYKPYYYIADKYSSIPFYIKDSLKDQLVEQSISAFVYSKKI